MKTKEKPKLAFKVATNGSANTKKTSLILDLFAGAGGLSEGFIRAGCEVVGHIEMDGSACETLSTRIIYHSLNKNGGLNDYKKYILGEISKESLVEKYELQKAQESVICEQITKDTYPKLIETIKKRLDGRALDIIVGGPPCQAYSHIGRSRDKQNMRNDERNYLYRYYIEFLKAFKPKIFVFENVPGLITAAQGNHLSDMRAAMKKAGYETDYQILNAADFGVPQNRKRVILVGWSKDSSITAYPNFDKVNRSYKAKDFLADLPPIAAGDQTMLKQYTQPSVLLEQLNIRDPRFNILLDHIARPHNKRDLEIYRRAVSMKNQGNNLKYNQLPDKLKTHKNTSGFLDRFKVINQNASGSHTIVAHISKDGNFYIHPDKQQNRSLSIREAARLQTFPDSYKFEGSRSARFKQIGNAVPPMLSFVIAKTILAGLKA